MKVNGNDRSIDYEMQESGNGIACGMISNIPVRLALAAQIMASSNSVTARQALNCADALIHTHNADVEEKTK